MANKRLLVGLIITTVFFGINTLVPLSVSAQTATVGQTIDSSAGALTFRCDLASATLEFDPVDINSPEPYFYSYYINPIDVYTDISLCDGSGLTIQDTRYEDGFVLQVNVNDYQKQGGVETIDLENLALVTQQANTSYSEDASGTSAFVGSGDSIIANSSDDEAEIEYTLPFDFDFYGTTYGSIYLCSNGLINFSDGGGGGDGNPIQDTDGDCSPADLFEDPGPTPHISPYYKDLDTTNYGIYALEYTEVGPGLDAVRFRWKAETKEIPSKIVEYEVILHDSGEEDYITFNYGDSLELLDDAAGPLVGITKGGAASTPISATYTESENSQLGAGTDLVDKQSVFRSGFDFTEIKKPGTPAAVATYNGNPSDDQDYTAFEEDVSPNSKALDIIDGRVAAPSIYGRIGLYTIYPSFRLAVPNTTVDGIYENTITFSLSTDP